MSGKIGRASNILSGFSDQEYLKKTYKYPTYTSSRFFVRFGGPNKPKVTEIGALCPNSQCRADVGHLYDHTVHCCHGCDMVFYRDGDDLHSAIKRVSVNKKNA